MSGQHEDDDIELAKLPANTHSPVYERDDDVDGSADSDEEGNRALLGESNEHSKYSDGAPGPQKLWPQIKNIVIEVSPVLDTRANV